MMDPQYLYNISITATDNMTTPGYSAADIPYPPFVFVWWNVMSALAVIVNLGHLMIIRMQKELHRTSYYNFKIFLLINGVFQLITAAFRLVFSNDYMQDILKQEHVICTASGVFLRISAAAIASLLLLVSIDRAICIKQCLKHYKKRYFVKLFPMLVIAVFLITPAIFITEGVMFSDAFSAAGPALCTVLKHKSASPISTPASIYQALAFTAIIVINIYTIIMARILILNTFKESQDPKMSRSQGSKRHIKCVVEISRSLGAIILWTVLAWLPRIINSRLEGAGTYIIELDYLAILLLGCHPLVMPLVYSLTNRTHRKLVMVKLSICFGVRPPTVSHSTDIVTATTDQSSSQGKPVTTSV